MVEAVWSYLTLVRLDGRRSMYAWNAFIYTPAHGPYCEVPHVLSGCAVGTLLKDYFPWSQR